MYSTHILPILRFDTTSSGPSFHDALGEPHLQHPPPPKNGQEKKNPQNNSFNKVVGNLANIHSNGYNKTDIKS